MSGFPKAANKRFNPFGLSEGKLATKIGASKVRFGTVDGSGLFSLVQLGSICYGLVQLETVRYIFVTSRYA